MTILEPRFDPAEPRIAAGNQPRGGSRRHARSLWRGVCKLPTDSELSAISHEPVRADPSRAPFSTVTGVTNGAACHPQDRGAVRHPVHGRISARGVPGGYPPRLNTPPTF